MNKFTDFYFSKLFNVHFGIAGMFGAYGALKGIDMFIDFLKTKKTINIKYKSLQQIVNFTCNSSVLTCYIISNSFINWFVALTFPISVPTLLYFCEEPSKDE